MNKKYVVRLEPPERLGLEKLVCSGKGAARKLTHARILLQADVSPEGLGWKDEQIAKSLGVTTRTVEHVRRRCVEEGFEAALNPKKREHPPVAKKLDGAKEAKLVAICCSKPPVGFARWTLKLLAVRMVELEIVDSVSRDTVRRTLQKTS
jgi:transposase